MKQIVQNLKNGEIEIVEVPMPSVSEKYVLVENYFSLISVGTEKGSVDFGKAPLIKKAIQRPDLVNQVLTNLRKEGINTTFKKVTNRLGNLSALGYSTSGVVKSSLDNDNEFRAGDRVACAGQNYASHAEFINVPQNLTVKIPDNVSFEEASFTTLGAIALQGVRQADPSIGENICVIGGGLLGQISCQILNANGCNVFAIDLSDRMVEMINKNKFATALNRNDDNLIAACEEFTDGYGFDKVIITAKASTNDPIVLSSKILKKKGEIIIVGEVPMEIPREPYFYKNELGLKISCSYGPGRYDHKYEEEGHDYPYGYVRWTEKRNMEAFLRLVSKKSIDLNPLITHVYEVDKAKEAYDMVLNSKDNFFVGVLLKYSEEKSEKTLFSHENTPIKNINIGFIGAGNYAQAYLIPTAKKIGSLDTVVTKTSTSCLSVSKKFGFNSYSTNSEDLLSNEKINTVFIASQNNTHAKYAINSLEKDKNVFLEKPLALNLNELEDIKRVYNKNKKNMLMVGFNRRFSDSAKIVKENFKNIDSPLIMNFRINAGFMSKDHWMQSIEVGGGRIIGEICHFIDLMQFYSSAKPISIFAENINTSNSEDTRDDNIAIIIKFDDGSVGNLIYTAIGDTALPKEKIEIFGGKIACVINDFKSVDIYKKNKKKIYKTKSGKGQIDCVNEFLDCLNKGNPPPINFDSIYLTTLTTFKIIDSLVTGLPQNIE